MYFGFDVFILDIELYMLGGVMVFMFLCLLFLCFYGLVSHCGTLVLIYIIRLFMVYVFLFYVLWK